MKKLEGDLVRMDVAGRIFDCISLDLTFFFLK